MGDCEFDKPRLEASLIAMRKASAAFYPMAVRTGNHAFIEFTGLLNEYIVMCEYALKAGFDFTSASVHTHKRLPFADHQVDYVREKLECIYGLKNLGIL